jgi:hypothetical protein
MKEFNRTLLISLGFVVVLVFSFQLGSAQQDNKVETKWEYMVLAIGGAHLDHGDAANHWTNCLSPFGDEGWELVSMSPETRNGSTLDMFATMKRRKN